MNGLMTAFAIAGGLALFIFGMHTMTDGRRGCAGVNLRRILSKAPSSGSNSTSWAVSPTSTPKKRFSMNWTNPICSIPYRL